ncbi:glycoside hydrolase family 5 protein [Methylobacterium sp. NMS14P]|uniref:glycoside hydrolase family 5 protein n=1 Tax=Methylobacterium sp. NMS14P TaxID=2894310 RepID=UPI0023594418|nr:glycoside hydrolase family 5 protein [Methylobacterium sp. NMS14P]WCS26513.1 glycoside hydrolase family 5 protein [Methylobacterium sp. NMS14P]
MAAHYRGVGILPWLGAAVLGLSLLVTQSAVAEPGASDRAAEAAARLGAGINILSDDPLWSKTGPARFKLADLDRIRRRGFQTVRINLQAFAHMDDARILDPDWLNTLDRVVDAAQAAGLNVILDEHDYQPCGLDPPTCKPRLMAFWQQVAARYSQRPDTVLFEILNEPNKGLGAEAWNELLAELIAEIRRTNPTRTLIVGPANWNSISFLPQLMLPEVDRNLIVTIHYYAPMAFTHQGAPWIEPPISKTTGVTWGTAVERAQIDADFVTAQDWGTRHGRPLLLGEFGAYETGDMSSRVAYTAAIARAAERQGWGWIYWQFDVDFRAFSPETDSWVAPIVGALLPDPPLKR